MKHKKLTAILTIIFLSFLFSACGKAVETSAEVKDSEVEVEEESTTEAESEETKDAAVEVESDVGEEEEIEDDFGAEELDPENRTYSTYPVFIEEFTLENGVLTVSTVDVNLAEFPIPEEMKFTFSYPLDENCRWPYESAEMTSDEYDSEARYAWFSFNLEGVVFELDAYTNGKCSYESDESFVKFNGIWEFTVVNAKVVEVAQREEEDVAEVVTANVETTDVAVADQSKVQETEKPVTTTPQPTATPAPHVHSYVETINVQPSCNVAGEKKLTCSCGDSKIESIPATGNHNWVEQTQVVHHDSEGEVQKIQIGTTDIIKCRFCEAIFSSNEEFTNHCLEYVGDGTIHAMSNSLIKRDQPVYEERWVVTVEAYDETIVVGYTCTSCGATR